MGINSIFKTKGTQQTHTCRFKVIRPVYETLSINDNMAEYIDPTTRLTTPLQIWEIFRFLGKETKEYFYTIHLDGKNKLLCLDLVSVGSLNQSIVHPREVFKSSLLSSAAAIILIHNHPTGDTTPSREDLEITRRLKEAGELLGIKILDHLIVGEETYTSFANQGLI